MAETGSASIDIDGSPDEIIDAVTDIEAYPDWAPAFKYAKVLEEDGEGRPVRAEFEVDARIKVVRYTLAYSYTPNKISWNLVEGDPKEITGSYTLEPKDGATEVTYEYSIDAGFPVPGFLKKQGVKIMVSSALNDLKRRVES
ncbi:MAG: SRPBCC family protein [Actinomycetota bacterium]